MAANKCNNYDDTVSDKASGLAWGDVCLRVCLCLRARTCASMGRAVWHRYSDSLDNFLTWFRNVVGCTGCFVLRACQFESVIALSYTPVMQRTCSTPATHMHHDVQHELFTYKFTVNVQDWTFAAPTPVLEWKCGFLSRGHFDQRFTGKMFVLHVCCMCVACALHGQALNWGSRKERGKCKSFRWQGRDFGSWARRICNELHGDGGP